MGELLTSAEVAQAAGEACSVVTGLRPVYRAAAVCGPAETCSCSPHDNLALHRALATATPGAVLVAATDGKLDGAYCGELMALDARNRGDAGIVVDGPARDLTEIGELVFPVFSRGTDPRSSRKERVESLGEPVSLQGVDVAPGDQVVADVDGVVIVPSAQWPAVQVRALALRAAEDGLRLRLREGERLSELIG